MKISTVALPGISLDDHPCSFVIRAENGDLKRRFLLNLIRTGAIKKVPMTFIKDLERHADIDPTLAFEFHRSAADEADDQRMTPAAHALNFLEAPITREEPSGQLSFVDEPDPDDLDEPDDL